MKPNKQYVQESRARKKAAGLVRYETWIKPEWRSKFDALIKRLKKE